MSPRIYKCTPCINRSVGTPYNHSFSQARYSSARIKRLHQVLICAWFANRTGNASDLYIPKLLTNLGYGSVYLIANLVGWPVLGLMLGPILGENLSWRNHPERKRAYVQASWLWVAMFFTRIAVQYPIYRSGNVNLLGTVNLAMGYPFLLLPPMVLGSLFAAFPQLSLKNER